MSWSDARAAPSTRRPAQSRIRPRPPAPVGWPGPAGHLKRLPRGVASRQSERSMVARNAGILLNRSPGPERAAIRSCPSPIPHRFRPNCCRWGRSRSTRGCAWPLHDASRPRQRGPSRVHRGLSPAPAAGTGAERNCRAACPDPAAWPRAAIRPGQGERLRRTLGAAPGTTPDIACKHTGLIVSEIPPDGGKQGAVCAECVVMGARWVHLRICRICGHVGWATARATAMRAATGGEQASRSSDRWNRAGTGPIASKMTNSSDMRAQE